MRVMIAPDSFGDTLTAAAAADAIARGWASVRETDELELAPQSDGGPGFVEVLASRIGNVQTADVDGPLGNPVRAHWLLDGTAAYIESAQACGLHLLDGPPTPLSALKASSYGVGQLLDAALDAGARTVFVGLGGSSCSDGGRAMIRALGGLGSAVARLSGIDLVAASDVENPLLGDAGAARVFGPQKGADADTVARLEESNTDWAAVLSAAGYDVADRPGAGAAGGLGAALFALGGRQLPGAVVVAERTGQQELLDSVDLVLTGEGKFDSQSLRGKLVTRIAAAGGATGIDTIVLAGQVTLSKDELESAGISAAHSISEFAGSVDLAMSDAANQLEQLAARVAADVVDTGVRARRRA
ncbi:glycerate kinase [Rhodococcus sp. IEGM 1370]|uniref:glycerate kinase family protein n=1 Tax=Rhodococcus sp. IEGM 1370 TaxID=3082222 RepID=UPI00295400CF|nr:glycerate kinase [Rhodococcus sp. IEGM 1370]MDV8076374.1 glycerate kinase [Rhodococcus sp. IEGM 1370]